MPTTKEPAEQQPILFVQTADFQKEIKALKKKYPSIIADLDRLLAILEVTPHTGTPLGKDCYKIRLAIKSKNAGKSSGARVITCVKIIETRIYLLTIYDKAERESVTDKELEALLKTLPTTP